VDYASLERDTWSAMARDGLIAEMKGCAHRAAALQYAGIA
jgi:hypothetical protein